MSFHQIAQGLWLKGCQTGITNLPVAWKKTDSANEAYRVTVEWMFLKDRRRNLRIGLKVAVVDRFNQLLCDFDNFLFASYNIKWHNVMNYCTRAVVQQRKSQSMSGKCLGQSADQGNLTSNQHHMVSSLRISRISKILEMGDAEKSVQNKVFVILRISKQNNKKASHD